MGKVRGGVGTFGSLGHPRVLLRVACAHLPAGALCKLRVAVLTLCDSVCSPSPRGSDGTVSPAALRWTVHPLVLHTVVQLHLAAYHLQASSRLASTL